MYRTNLFSRKELLPSNIRHQKTEQNWRIALQEHHEGLVGVSQEEARRMYMLYCIQLPFFGFHLFSVRHASDWDLPSDFYVAINVSGLFFCSADKEVYFSFPFMDVITHLSTPFSLQIGFDNNQQLEMRTNAGDEIISLIIDYKYAELKAADPL